MATELEQARLDALRRLELLDSEPSEAFDRITRMASVLFGLPIAAVSLTDQDRQWFKSRVGVAHTSIPRDRAPCAQVAETTTVLVVPDLLADPRYRDSHLARGGIRFYAGAPLTTRDGFGLGALCVLGLEPRQASVLELASLTDLASIVMAQIELQHAIGRVDPVSGMANRTQFIEDLTDLVGDRPINERRLAVLIDLASPEQVSNTIRVMGATYVDDMIDEAARVIKAAIGPERRAYHVAATQFALLAPPGTEEGDYVPALAEMLRHIRSAANSRFVTTTTIGVAPFELGRVDPIDLLRMAHCAALDARGLETRVSVYSHSQDTRHSRRFTLLNDFGTALDAPDQLRLVYHPRIDIASQACVGTEALLRWQHPTLGEIPPGEFMPIVEQTPMIRATTVWVVDTALRQLAAWRDQEMALQMSVNVSASNLLEPDFVGRIVAGLRRYALAPNLLELEITESFTLEDVDRAIATLDALAIAGVRLAIDDFGTGYSSLSYLQRLPVHTIKIDQSFIRDVAADRGRSSIVTAMTSLSHDLGHRVVAEGVETAEMLDIVTQSGCDEAQGYLYGRPMEPTDFVAWYQGQPVAAFGGDRRRQALEGCLTSTSLAYRPKQGYRAKNSGHRPIGIGHQGLDTEPTAASLRPV
jgi:EAL domain-containing protein (putative c-di-GMP-specific phosphodiesterase class I)/GGDEF domain-containing protein